MDASPVRHKAEIVPGTLKRNSHSGGLEFVMRCCGELEKSVHLQNLAAYETHEQRLEVIAQYLAEHEEAHAGELATEEFLRAYLETGAVADATGDSNCDK